MIGRVVPLARQLSKDYTVHVLSMGSEGDEPNMTFHVSGQEPFIRTPAGKQRLKGFSLVWRMLQNAFQAGKLEPVRRRKHPDRTASRG